MIKNKIVIFLEGGLIQRIDSDKAIEILIFDQDTDCGDDERLQPIRDVDGTVEDTYVSRWYIEPDSETVEYFFSQVNKEGENEET